MQKFELAGMFAAMALMALVVAMSWPGKRAVHASPLHTAARR